MDILCVGQLVTDILVKPVDSICFDIDTKRVSQISMKNGGDCFNTAIGLSILGNSVGFAGVVGEDAFGEFLVKTAGNYGIDTRGLRVLPQVSTSAVVVLINDKGERVFLYYGGSNDQFSCEYVDFSQIDECKLVHVGGTYLMPGFDGSGAAEVFMQAHSKNKMTSMDVTWDTTGRWLDVIAPCLKHLDFFMPSYNEAKEITQKQKPEDIAGFLTDRGVKNVVIKLGKEGSYVKGQQEEFYMEAYDVDVVDTTGAGDSFAAGFLTGVVRNWSLRECARFASAVSAHCIQHLGATTGIPGFDDVMEFIKKNNQ